MAVPLLCLALVAAACGDDDSDTSDATTTTTAGSTETTAAGGTDTALDELVAAAQAEGSVTIYSSQGQDQLNNLADAFKAEYSGIDVNVVRDVDANIIPRVETELQTGTSGGDLVVLAAQQFMETHASAGDFVDPTASPQLAGDGDYDASLYVHDGNIFEVGAAVLTFGWNTDLVPDGLTDYPICSILAQCGKIGVPDPAIGPALVDFYLWLEQEYGEDYLTQLAAQEPRIYPSSLPMGEALQSGEIYAGAFTAPVQLVPAKESGAPVDFGISEDHGAWGARYFGAIPKSSDHPNAAALLANFMVTAQGQEIVQGASGSVIPDVPGTLITNDRVREADLEATAPEPAAAYVEKWNKLFR